MDILIKLDKGIPRTHESLVIDEDNEVRIYGTDVVIGNAIELPPHGRLISEAHLASLIISNIKRLDDADEYTDGEKELVRNVYKSCLYKLSVTPTILEAST